MKGSPIDRIQGEALRAKIIEVLKTIHDPEIPLNIYDLGLIYGIEVEPGNRVHIRMTLTSPACPVAESLPPQVESRVNRIAAVADVKVEVVWDPPWSPDRLDDAAKLELGLL
ncbi:MAG TPA: DUF59 domain-containing protein [Phycisphaerae bacterium]|nr:DUF59 domain-containing protein [Phycisphaerae bacterium]